MYGRGGVNAYSLPYLLKSSDGGDTWQDLENITTGEQVCYDVASHPENRKLILAGFFGTINDGLVIRKSTDGGETWSTVNKGFGTLTFAHSARNPEVVYASGENADGTLFFSASQDFGDSWEMIKMPGSPTNLQVNDMVSVMENGHEVLYFGTDQGIFSYIFSE